MRWTIMPSSGSCQLRHLKSLKSGGQPIAIDLPVGAGPLARNKSDDVKVIQDALNQITVEGFAGGAMPFLAVDGICGPKTIAAISNFQRVQLQIFDGVIEPNKKTIIKLNELIDPLSDSDLQIKVNLALPLVGQSIQAALSNLQAVITGGPSTTGPAAVATDRLNRHFRLDTLSPLKQSNARVDLFRTFTHFNTIMVNATSLNIAPLDEFDLDKQNPKIALTRGKGFFEEGEVDDETNKRLDRIHLGLGFFAPRITPEFGAFIIIHELAHFVGHADGSFIEDNGRGWFDDVFIKPLTANLRLTNADSYATFAHECRTGSPVKPPFVKTAPGGLGGAR